MFKRIRNIIATSVIALSFVAPSALLVGSAAAFTPTPISNGLCEGVDATNTVGNSAAGDQCLTDPGGRTDLQRIAQNVINIFSLVIGVIAVIMIIVGGLKYFTSGGDSGNITGAKNTILYALIGLVIVALSQIIVRFVLNKATQ